MNQGMSCKLCHYALPPCPFSFFNADVPLQERYAILGGSWVVISMVIIIRLLIWAITRVTLLITPLIPTHEPPSKDSWMRWDSTGLLAPTLDETENSERLLIRTPKP